MVLLDNVEIREKNTGWSERNGISKEPRGTAHKAISSDTQKNPTLKRHFSENIKVNMTVSMIFWSFRVFKHWIWIAMPRKTDYS